MRRTQTTVLTSFAALLLAFTIGGCNDVTGVMGDDDGDEKEVRVTVAQVGADFVVSADGIRYLVTGDTEFEGLDGLADVSQGEEVEIEYEPITNSDNRRALEIEDENEVRITVAEVGPDFIVSADGIRYLVTDNTEFEGLNGLSDVSVGEEVEIEYEPIANSDNRRALEIEIEPAGAEDDDD